MCPTDDYVSIASILFLIALVAYSKYCRKKKTYFHRNDKDDE